MTTQTTPPTGGIYRHGRTYFKATWIKSRKAYRFHWLTPGGDVPSGKYYPTLPEGTRKLKGKPSPKQLRNSWLIRPAT